MILSTAGASNKRTTLQPLWKEAAALSETLHLISDHLQMIQMVNHDTLMHDVQSPDKLMHLVRFTK